MAGKTSRNTCKTDPGEAVCTWSDAQKCLGKVSSRATVSTLLTSSDGTSESSRKTPWAWALDPSYSPIRPPASPSLFSWLSSPALLRPHQSLPLPKPSPSTPPSASPPGGPCSQWQLPHHYTPCESDPSRSPPPRSPPSQAGVQGTGPGTRVRVHRDG